MTKYIECPFCGSTDFGLTDNRMLCNIVCKQCLKIPHGFYWTDDLGDCDD